MKGWYVDEYLKKAKTEKTTIEELNKAWESLGQKFKCLEAMNNNLIGALERPTGPIARYRGMDKMEKKRAKKSVRCYCILIGCILFVAALFYLAIPSWGAEKKTLYYQDDAGKEFVVGEIWAEDNMSIHGSSSNFQGFWLDASSPVNPCDQPHEIEVEYDTFQGLNGRFYEFGEPKRTDWGSKNCRFIKLGDAYIFNVSPGSVEIGFRSDGIMVWRYGKEKGD